MTADAKSRMTPERALARMKAGNERFVERRMLNRDLADQVNETSAGQFPHSAVLGCIDSRVPPEIVFDQGVGDIFSGRVAGNFVNDDMLGSFEYATRIAGAKLIMVLGHTECGAIMGACDDARLGLLTGTLANLMPAVESVRGVGERSSGNPRFVKAASEMNVRLTVDAITQRSEVIRDMVRFGDVRVVGAMYDVGTGRVAFFD